jgi:uncharacterized protein with von Willebrand factor type A (vWA) domain
VFDRLFDLYWRAKPEYTDGLLQQPDRDDLVELAPEEGEEAEETEGSSIEGARGRRLDAIEAIEEAEEGEGGETESLADAFSYSPAEILREKDFADFTEDELAQIRRFMQQLTWQIGRRRSRRKVASPKGRFIDPRRTMRRSLQSGGVPLTLARRQTKTKPRQLVVICDVSGSMDRYSRILLQFIYAVENGMAKVEAFVFGTRLTRVTRLLKHQDIDEAMRRVAREVQDWSGGTRIGQSLQSFNQEVGPPGTPQRGCRSHHQRWLGSW